ncbi:hypothetical protein BS78_10G167100 [Paspalum vaginatum]|nr:hypothetical protein BS78_10G167100 [Paspalum vaginatum]
MILEIESKNKRISVTTCTFTMVTEAPGHCSLQPLATMAMGHLGAAGNLASLGKSSSLKASSRTAPYPYQPSPLSWSRRI